MDLTYRKRKYLSVSTLLQFVRCKRRYFYQKNGLEMDSMALNPLYGGAMHKGVPVALQTNDIELSLQAFRSVWDEIEEQAVERELPPDKARCVSAARRSLSHYIHTHKDNKSIFKLIPPPEGAIPVDELTSEFEVPWAIDIGLPIPLVGRCDGFCQHRDTGEYWVWEFKTTTRLASNFFEAHEMAVQNMTYALAASTMTELDIQGVIVEGMLVSASKVDNMTQPIPVLPHQLKFILKWLYRYGKELLECENQMALYDDPAEVWTQNWAGCTPYAWFYMPGWRCEFSDMCKVADWRERAPLYKVNPEHDFLALSIEGNEIVKTSSVKE